MTSALPNLPKLEAPSPRAAVFGELDPSILASAVIGDPVALETFVRTYETRIFAFIARSTGRGPHVEDLAQEIFLKALVALPRFETRSERKLSSWLFSIASHHLSDVRKKKRPFVSDRLDEERSPNPTPEDSARRSDVARAIERAILELPVAFREPFVLREFHGLALSEIGAILGVRPETIKTRVARAREQLRLALENFGEESR